MCECLCESWLLIEHTDGIFKNNIFCLLHSSVATCTPLAVHDKPFLDSPVNAETIQLVHVDNDFFGSKVVSIFQSSENIRWYT